MEKQKISLNIDNIDMELFEYSHKHVFELYRESSFVDESTNYSLESAMNYFRNSYFGKFVVKWTHHSKDYEFHIDL